MVIAIIIGCFFIVLVIAMNQASQNKEKINEATNEIKTWMEDNEFKVTSDLTFYNGSLGYTIYIDESSKRMILLNTLNKMKNVLEFENIIGMEIIEDGISTNGIGRAVVGGALFGGVGAIVGSNTGKKMVSNINAVIYTNCISNPQIGIILNRTKIKTDSIIYRNTMDFARKLDATVRAIISQNENRE
ncbi:hypothetical protein [Anaerovorax odorimutans]|uniref:hypothetical protein n=1 Tax=Anaerovorax odorimutans TaxID=109327 RepID=UPI000429B1EC|nr:hypothetical protein [Anaerovorax odorimutans]